MARTTEEEVRNIIEVDASITDLTPFITAASAMVDTHCSGLAEEVALIVETWLAAHLITIRDMRVASEGVTGANQSFQYKVDLGLACSMYGQTAMNLDSSGGLARWNAQILAGKAGRVVLGSWLGTDEV